MGCLCSRILTDSKNIDMSDFTPKHASFEYLSPRGQIIVQIDEKYKLSVLILDFDECVRKSVRLWPQNSVQRNQFIDLERTLLNSPSLSSSNSGYSSGYDTVF